jgi:hypothetical protein
MPIELKSVSGSWFLQKWWKNSVGEEGSPMSPVAWLWAVSRLVDQALSFESIEQSDCITFWEWEANTRVGWFNHRTICTTFGDFNSSEKRDKSTYYMDTSDEYLLQI